MKVQQIHRTATVAWSHTSPLVATGTLVGTMSENFDPTGTLELFQVDYKQGASEPRAKIKTDEKLYKLAWSRDCSALGESLHMGLIAGGLENGVIGLWNPSRLLQGDGDALWKTKQKHVGAVRGLDFNPFRSSLLASGGANGEVFIWDLANEGALTPADTKGPGGDSEITSVAWNRQVEHILASSATNGVTVVWDLRAKRPALHFTDPSSNRKCTSVVWNPDSPIRLFTTIDDDSNPVVHVWDLTNYLAPTETLRGHTGGVLSASISPHDHDLLLTSGRDGKVICWDLKRPEGDKKISEVTGDSWKFDVQWAPTLPCIASTCGLGGQIDITSYNDFPHHPSSSKPLPAPRQWLKRPATVAFAFGGQLVSVPMQKGNTPSKVEIHTVTIKDSDFLEKAQKLHSVVSEKKFVEFCEEKISALPPTQKADSGVWEFLKLLFESDPRAALLNKLGFDPEKMSGEVAAFLEKLEKDKKEPEEKEEKPEEKTEDAPAEKTEVDNLFAGSSSDFDLGAIAKAVAPPSAAVSQEVKPVEVPKIDFRSEDPVERLVTKCLLVGNFQHAVDCCFGVGRISDALVLAYIGGPELLKRTQQRYLSQQKSSFMNLISLIVKKEFATLVKSVDLEDWKEVLAILCAWTEGEFPALCEMLGDRLYTEKGDTHSALLAYICAANLDKAITLWTKEEITTNVALQGFIERAVVFANAIHRKSPGSVLGHFYTQYAERLAGQGQVDVALTFLEAMKDEKDTPGAILYNRIKPQSNATPAASSTQPRTTATGARPPAIVQPMSTTPTSTPTKPGSRPMFVPHTGGTPTSVLPPTSPSTAPGPRMFPSPSLFPQPGPVTPVTTPIVPTTPVVPTPTQVATPTLASPTPSLLPAPPSRFQAPTPGGYTPPVIKPTFTPSPTTFTPSATPTVGATPMPPRGGVVAPAPGGFIPAPSFIPTMPTPAPSAATVVPPPPRAGTAHPPTPTPMPLPTPAPTLGLPTPGVVLPPTTTMGPRPGAGFATAPPPPATVNVGPVAPRVAPPTAGFGYAPPPVASLGTPVSVATSPVAPPPPKKEPEVVPPPPTASGVKRKIDKPQEEPLVDGTETAQRLVHFAHQVSDFPEAASEMTDITPRLNEFAERAANSSFPASLLQLVDDLLLAFSQRDFAAADRIYTQLSQNHYTAVGPTTMVGFKKFKALVSSF